MTSATHTEAEQRADRARGSKFSAALYDPTLWLGERAGMAARRKQIVGQASGSVLEIGAGTGLNFASYPSGLDRLVLCEPEPNMANQLRKRVAQSGRDAEIVRAPGELLPFDDESFDTVVGTLVLCTVEDPGASLAELSRVLKPGGKYLLIEHVRSDNERAARWQDRLRGPWSAFADGCQCNRETAALIEAAGFETDGVEHESWKRMPPLVKPLISGVALKAS